MTATNPYQAPAETSVADAAIPDPAVADATSTDSVRGKAYRSGAILLVLYGLLGTFLWLADCVRSHAFLIPPIGGMVIGFGGGSALWSLGTRLLSPHGTKE